MPAQSLDGVRSTVEDHGVAAGNITRSVLESSIASRNMALNPSEQEVSTSIDTARCLFDQLCGEISAKRVRCDGQLKITTLVRLHHQLEPSKKPRVFMKRKRSNQRAGSQSTTMF
ncbi:hypothetical protein H257_09648 [Aphanomyces astaci]|uniref:Uncharacterized protein n=1 Tax=Aphanomyces astaci TaxID=112090 RepID=W4GAP1_APHAT|nr:hypothetical protein H257_09648 [Aphanomyces astaci]ETV76114.1 hypothetical protein H257_09648 [Aphanomyces astaci]|eukprot:XP_009834239.1 hypothetical protein H257_09648 [Aphanomyces astaci]